MTATFKLYGPLKSYTDNQIEVEVPDGQTVRQALEELDVPVALVALVVVNEDPQGKDYLLQPGDKVKVMAVLGGG